MEKRKSERVQFFQLPRDHALLPVWVFHRAHPDSVLGLLLDISVEGVQISTDKSVLLQGDTYRMFVHSAESDDTASTDLISVLTHRLWSKSEGGLYTRHGFAFEWGIASMPSLEKLLAARATGNQWFRCELVMA